MSKLPAVIAGAAVISTLAFGAQAADLLVGPSYDVQPEAASVGSSGPFTGFYIGGAAGIVSSNDFDEDFNAGAVGAQIGYTQQFGAFVVGAELEALWLDDLQYALDPLGGLTQDWAVSAKARAGLALDHTLLYGTLGYSVTEFGTYGTAATDDDLTGGWLFGVGIEQALTDNISARIEYQQTRYTDFASVGGIAYDDDVVNHAVKAGVNFRF